MAFVRSTTRNQSPFVLLSFLVPFCILCVYINASLHYGLPTPGPLPHPSTYSNTLKVFGGSEAQTLPTSVPPHNEVPKFSEALAMNYIKHLTTNIGYRIVGTKELEDAELWLMKILEGLKKDGELARKAKGGDVPNVEMEVWHQKGSGSHLFDFMHKKVWKKYYVSNIIVRLSDGTEESKANAILVNAHLDSTLPSPGAADDLHGVSTMLEAIRIVSQTPWKLSHSIVLLFNGAEESLQDASHLFITKHKLKDTIRAVINVEACGVAGPEILFQATSEEMIRAYSKVPHPYGAVMATEVFQTGVIVSDTDFRQFEQYGNLTGLDMALVQNSYLYHTRLDIPERIEAGALQHTGENVLAMLADLTSANSDLPSIKRRPKSEVVANFSTVFFSGFGGRVFILYSSKTAMTAYTILGALAVILVGARMRRDRLTAYALTLLAVPASLIGAVLSANVSAMVMAHVLGRPLSWYRNEIFSVILFGPPAALGVLLFQYALLRFISARGIIKPGEGILEHGSILAQLVYNAIMAIAGQSARIGSSYLFAVSGFATLSIIILNDLVLVQGEKGERKVHYLCYFLAEGVAFLFGTEGIITFLDLFVPLSGRLGHDAPVDNIMATVVAAATFMILPMFIPLFHRFGERFLVRSIAFFALVTGIVMIVFSRPGWSTFDADHPQRFFSLHMENISTVPPTYSLHVAAVDPVPGFQAVMNTTLSAVDIPDLDPHVQLNSINDDIPDWDIIYPVNSFLLSFKVPLPTSLYQNYVSTWRTTFRVTAEDSKLNAMHLTRSFKIVMDHPDLIWPVLAFTADVVSWDLPEPAERGVRRHHVKSMSTFGRNRWSLEVTVQLTQDQFDAAQRLTQVAKGQRAYALQGDEDLGTLRIDYSALDENGMYPAKAKTGMGRPAMDFFEKMDRQLPDYMDSMLLSAVAGVARI